MIWEARAKAGKKTQLPLAWEKKLNNLEEEKTQLNNLEEKKIIMNFMLGCDALNMDIHAF